MAELPVAKAPKALNAVKTGIKGKKPPTLGILITLGRIIFDFFPRNDFLICFRAVSLISRGFSFLRMTTTFFYCFGKYFFSHIFSMNYFLSIITKNLFFNI